MRERLPDGPSRRTCEMRPRSGRARPAPDPAPP